MARLKKLSMDEWLATFMDIPTPWVKPPRCPGRKDWLQYMGENHREDLVCIIEDLEEYPYMLMSSQAVKKMRFMSTPTFNSFVRKHGVKPIKDPIINHPTLGFARASARAVFYDPRDLADVLLGKLNDLGDDRAQTLPMWDVDVVRSIPVLRRKKSNHAKRDRWTKEELDVLIASAANYGQWIMPSELCFWLRVTQVTLLHWRRGFNETNDWDLYPPHIQGREYHPSCAIDPVTGRVGHGMLSSKRGRHDPVLYDRDQVVAWLEGLLSRR